jgi:CoA:oxalate CoA-transferase
MVVQGIDELMSVTGQPDGKPTRVGTSIGDITAGLFTTIGINAALFDREKTGKGTKIDVSMLDCQIAILENAIARYFSNGEILKPMGSRHPSITPFEAYKTKNSFIIISAGNDKLFENLCNALNCKEYIKDKRFINDKLRNTNAEDLKVILEKYLINEVTNHWIKLFTKMSIPCDPIYNIKQAVENPQVAFRNMIVSSDDKKIGKFIIAGNPIKMSNYKDPKTRGEIPELDHTEKRF